jgi:hypothetical protein
MLEPIPRFLLLLLVVLLVTSALALGEVGGIFPTLPKGDPSPINRYEANMFGRALCGSPGGLSGDWGACDYSTADGLLLTFDRHPAQHFLYVLYGSFTEVGAQEVLLGLARAETDVLIVSGVLLQRVGSEWQAVQFMAETLDHAYLMFPGKDGRSVLVGRQDEREFMRPGEGVEINVLRIGTDQVVTEPLFRYVNQHPACPYPPAPDARRVEITHWARQDVNGDGDLDLVVELLETELPELVCDGEAQPSQDAEALEQVSHRLVFLFDGQHFEPTPETAQIIERLARLSQ